MIKTVKISNFKSVQELELELGRLNVFIGENGCGKTNILEGIAIGSAASGKKLDDEFLSSRGIRVVESQLMISAFPVANRESILIDIDGQEVFDIHFISPAISGRWLTIAERGYLATHEKIKGLLEMQELVDSLDHDSGVDIPRAKAQIEATLAALQKAEAEGAPIAELNSFIIYAPENTYLRRFEEEGQIRPLGIRGEGLFRHLVELSKEEPETFKAVADQLSLIDWYGGMNIPNNLQFSERRISITDRFIADTIKEFDQRSANEGFLYLLFYFTLFLSKYTPKFFAIDNIDNSLNPKLCAKLVETLAKLAKEQDKQAILTTHNPAVLDGLDLTNDEQRLFVIYRNADGETKARRVKPLVDVPGTEPIRLSEAFVRGYLGGLPSNF